MHIKVKKRELNRLEDQSREIKEKTKEMAAADHERKRITDELIEKASTSRQKYRKKLWNHQEGEHTQHHH